MHSLRFHKTRVPFLLAKIPIRFSQLVENFLIIVHIRNIDVGQLDQSPACIHAE